MQTLVLAYKRALLILHVKILNQFILLVKVTYFTGNVMGIPFSCEEVASMDVLQVRCELGISQGETSVMD